MSQRELSKEEVQALFDQTGIEASELTETLGDDDPDGNRGKVLYSLARMMHNALDQVPFDYREQVMEHLVGAAFGHVAIHGSNDPESSISPSVVVPILGSESLRRFAGLTRRC